MAPLAGVRLDAIATKWKLVWALMMAPHSAMPTAPPRLRIMLKSPLAYLSRSGGRLASPRLTAGGNAKKCGRAPKSFGGKRWTAPPPRGKKEGTHHSKPDGR